MWYFSTGLLTERHTIQWSSCCVPFQALVEYAQLGRSSNHPSKLPRSQFGVPIKCEVISLESRWRNVAPSSISPCQILAVTMIR